MKDKIYQIQNTEFQFDPTAFPAVLAYLIVGEQDGKAVINQFGEEAMPHQKAIKWYEEQDVTVAKVYTNGQLMGLAQLKDKHNQKPIDEVIGELEQLLE